MHDEHSLSRNELWLARRLREAADHEQPQFSESLHRRIMQSIRSNVADATPSDAVCAEPAAAVMRRNDVPQAKALWRNLAWLTSAAAILAMVIAAKWFAGPQVPADSQPIHPATAHSVAVQPPIPIATTVTETADSNSAEGSPSGNKPNDTTPNEAAPNDIASAVANYTLDDLSRDAQATAHVLVDQLPFETPAEEWGL